MRADAFETGELAEAALEGADSQALEREGARCLVDALGLAGTLHVQGRDAYRELLARAIDLATRALASEDPATVAGARTTLARAHWARAEDALHGAGQLSLSAQRAPTSEACDEGWRRVETIVAGAERSARVAADMASALEEAAHSTTLVRAARAARAGARKAEAAALAARRIVDERNHAYTFHTDPGFSFGEGWHVAAAAALGGATVQIEPGRAGSAQAERFLVDAGLGGRLQPYRSRPRAMKQTTEIVARAFEADPASAQRVLRAAFLGDAPIPHDVVEWTDRRLVGAPARGKVLLWVRVGTHDRHRNTTAEELAALAACVDAAGLAPVVTGEAVPSEDLPAGALDLTRFRADPVFSGLDARRAQLQLFEHLRRGRGVVGQIGVTTAGMDGPALMGLPTIFLTEAPNVRMRAWAGVVPGYRQIVRAGDVLEQVGQALAEWARPGFGDERGAGR